MPIVIQNPKSLGVSLSSEYFGENTKYRRIKKVNFSGYVFDLTNQIGVEGVIDGVEGIVTSYLTSYQDVVVNGHNLGVGELESLSFSAGNDVRIKTYSCSFVFYESVTLTDFVSGVSTTNFKFLEELDETLVVDEDVEGRRKLTHSINVKFGAGASSSFNSISFAKILAGELYSANFSNVSTMWGASSNCSTLYDESYNEIDHSCSFSKRFEIAPDGQVNDGVTVKKSLSFEFSGEGVVVVTESGDYSSNSESLCFNSAMNRMNADLANAFINCAAFYNGKRSKVGTTKALSSSFFERSVQISRKDGKCSYKISFSNDIFYQPQAFWSYTLKASSSKDGFNTATESGQIIGKDVIKGQEKSQNAKNFWATVKGGIQGRCSSVLGLAPVQPSGCDGGLTIDSFSVTKHNRNGTIDYEYTYTTDPSKNTGNPQIKKIVSSCTNGDVPASALKLGPNYLIPNYGEIKYVNGNNKGLQVESECTAYGKEDAPIGVVISAANGCGGCGGAGHKDSETISIDLTQKIVSKRITYIVI